MIATTGGIDVPPVGLSPDEKIVYEAHERFRLGKAWTDTAYERMLFDEKFVNGDAHNLYQWPDTIYSSREIEDRPTLTINKTRQHCLQIINDAKQNKPGINFRPTGGGATYRAAKTLQAVARAIEYRSNAEQAYDWATEKQVKRGMGFVRVVTEYTDDWSFDQEIFIRRIKQPENVYLDPNIQEADGSDAMWGLIFSDVDREWFEQRYPDHKEVVGRSALGSYADGSWLRQKTVRMAEYFRRKMISDELALITGEDGEPVQILRSSVTDAVFDAAVKAEQEQSGSVRRRKMVRYEVEWFMIAGDTIISRRPWPGQYIPIARCVGEETLFDGVWDCKGHVRALIDAQRIYNYNSSASVEYGALQTKTPYKAAAESIAGYETYWNNLNTTNPAVLPFKAIGPGGEVLPVPEREQPPAAAQAFLMGMQIAEREMMMASGQFEAQFGQKGNERSGVAINERQRQGDNATYHFIDGQAIMIKYVGRIILDLIPHIYDTERLVRIKGEDGDEFDIRIDPNAEQAVQERQLEDQEAMEIIFNPNVGRYAVFADMGPSFATQRQEAFNALTQVLQGNAELWKVIGDLFFRTADFALAEEIAERMKRVIPAHILGKGPSPEVVELQGKLESITQMVQSLVEDGAKEELEKARLRNDSSADSIRVQIDKYRAETERFNVVSEKILADNAQIKEMFQMLLDDMRATQERVANAQVTQGEEAA